MTRISGYYKLLIATMASILLSCARAAAQVIRKRRPAVFDCRAAILNFKLGIKRVEPGLWTGVNLV